MSLWGRIFAATYDRMLSGTERAGLADMRRQLLSGARGRVLEIGAGTGLNLSQYPADVELVLTEPEAPMARRLRRRASEAGRSAQVVEAPGDRLPFPDDSFDTVVSTLVLCTVPDALATLAEIRRVLRPGGTLLLIEHVRSEDGGVARWQDRLHPLWVRVGHGCHCNRDTLATLRAAGFSTADVQPGRLPKAPPWVRPAISGTASVTDGAAAR